VPAHAIAAAALKRGSGAAIFGAACACDHSHVATIRATKNLAWRGRWTPRRAPPKMRPPRPRFSADDGEVGVASDGATRRLL